VAYVGLRVPGAFGDGLGLADVEWARFDGQVCRVDRAAQRSALWWMSASYSAGLRYWLKPPWSHCARS